jgi:glyoxylase-like metal-dependent hydrolase (beta-lactamase superfamily II)
MTGKAPPALCLRHTIACWLGCLLSFLWSQDVWATAPCPPGLPLLEAAAPGVWVWEGQRADISLANRGHVVTNVVLVGEHSTVVVDPGPSLAHGRALLEAVRCQRGREVDSVVNTHAHAENVMGNAAFAELGRPILATASTQASMQERCPACLESITRSAGADALQGTAIVVPNTPLSNGQTLDLGGQRWQVLEMRSAHTESDLVLWNATNATLIAGGLVYRDRLPELAQGSLVGWVHALNILAGIRPTTVIGLSTGTLADLVSTRRYLCDLAQAVWQAMDAGSTAHDGAGLQLPAFVHWASYTERHSFNAQRAWRELEPLWMAEQPRPCSVPDVGR